MCPRQVLRETKREDGPGAHREGDESSGGCTWVYGACLVVLVKPWGLKV